MTLIKCFDSPADPQPLDTAEAMFPFLCNAQIGLDSVFQNGGSVDLQHQHHQGHVNSQAPPQTS